jgi:hypothetical protein
MKMKKKQLPFKASISAKNLTKPRNAAFSPTF